MRDEEQDRLLYEGYYLGLRVSRQARVADAPTGEEKHHWDLLRAVADGQLTLRPSAAEIMVRYPNMTEAMKAGLVRNAERQLERDREVARKILAAGQGKTVDEPWS